MKLQKISLLIIGFILVAITQIIAQDAAEIIKKLEIKIKSVNNFSYETSYKQINSSIGDSIYLNSGNVWGKKAENDSIFGCYFHVKGKDKRFSFDYYYDGLNGIEILHSWKKITVIDPLKYPNNPNNPAKARIAVLPFIDLLIDNNIYSTLYKNNPRVSVEPNHKYGDVTITFIYPPNSVGQLLTRRLFIDQEISVIKRIETLVLWNGTTQKIFIDINNFRINQPIIQSNISMINTFSPYSTENYGQNNEIPQAQSNDILGNSAPTFTYKSYTNNIVSLSDYKGKIVLLDFWETWCGHCIVSLPRINQLYKKYQDIKLQIVGITTENTAQTKKIIGSNNLLYTNLIADKTILKNYKVSSRPTYILINQEGKIILVTYGDLDSIEKKIEEII